MAKKSILEKMKQDMLTSRMPLGYMSNITFNNIIIFQDIPKAKNIKITKGNNKYVQIYNM